MLLVRNQLLDYSEQPKVARFTLSCFRANDIECESYQAKYCT